MRPVAETGELSRLRFKMYSIYSWGCPVFISFVAIIVDSLPEDFDVIRPGFGTKKCWFAGECLAGWREGENYCVVVGFASECLVGWVEDEGGCVGVL